MVSKLIEMGCDSDDTYRMQREYCNAYHNSSGFLSCDDCFQKGTTCIGFISTKIDFCVGFCKKLV